MRRLPAFTATAFLFIAACGGADAPTTTDGPPATPDPSPVAALLAGSGLSEEQTIMTAHVAIEANARNWAVVCVGELSEKVVLVGEHALNLTSEVKTALGLDDRDWVVGAPLQGSFLVTDLSSPASNATEFVRRAITSDGDSFVCLLPSEKGEVITP